VLNAIKPYRAIQGQYSPTGTFRFFLMFYSGYRGFTTHRLRRFSQ
jgi:hypothetical protein